MSEKSSATIIEKIKKTGMRSIITALEKAEDIWIPEQKQLGKEMSPDEIRKKRLERDRARGLYVNSLFKDDD